MSVVGIDLGNLQSYIAVARNRGIDIITNEVSNRATPALVSFGPKQRFLGESAKTQEVFNWKNTVSSLKRLIGRSFQDKDIQDIESRFITAPLCDVNGEVGARVQYLETEHTFSATQLVAMYLSKLRDSAAAELKMPVTDVVLSIPGWYTDSQRRSILNASEIAGLRCLRLMTDPAAAALAYGITKTDLPEDKPRHVAFVDMGHSTFSVAIVAFRKGQLTIKSTSYDRHLGGRYFDEALCTHFAEAFKEKYKIDIPSNKKAMLRLRVGCEKLKKVLSANPQAMINVENIMEDVDASAMMKREEFEELVQPLLDRMRHPLQQALENSGLSIQDIDVVEVVGGSTRVPAVKQALTEFFQTELSYTLNQDEAVARGCALQCAILSPVFKVREFQVRDTNSYPIKFTWEPVKENPADCELTAFPRNNVVPSTKILTFYRRNPFDIEAYYEKPDELPDGIKPWIGRFTVKGVTPEADGELATVKVKARLNIHGILTVDSAYTVEEVVEEVPVDTSAMDQDSPAPGSESQAGTPQLDQEEPAPAATKKVKKLVRKQDLPVLSGTSTADTTLIQQLLQLEGEMAAADKLVLDTEHQKNALEEYVYDIRSKLEAAYGPFIDPKVKAQFMSQLTDTEDWLYGEGDNTTKSVYAEKLAELKLVGQPVVERFQEHEAIPKAANQLRDTTQQFLASASSHDDRFAHIPTEDKEKVVERAEEVQTWLEASLAKHESQSKYQPLAVTAQQIMDQRSELVRFATPIMSKPKPKPAAPEAAATSPNAPDDASEQAPSTQGEKKEETKATSEMDVD
ncbi:adenyl-nucleotide exchange factor sse1 [Dimargaris xerosporica]|nr:adenyl-nucleotide exchange factor sse1 [Dimargaris xerosporica]